MTIDPIRRRQGAGLTARLAEPFGLASSAVTAGEVGDVGRAAGSSCEADQAGVENTTRFAPRPGF